eukprot:TRINITY_DN134_c0_g7_i1.p1 TRINITY_DN134_c0_g7~~TRINITY_DN134_c0_g7_i1.p1  ORF type:complete len:154 (+),score=11.49 TRINITY_DN134_c0_g7_i1:50-511(+)
MAWQPYVDSSLVGTGHVKFGAIFGIEGSSGINAEYGMENIVSTTRPVEPTVRSPGPTNSRPPGPAVLSSDPPPTTQLLRHVNVPGAISVSRNLPPSMAGFNVQHSVRSTVAQTLTSTMLGAQISPAQVANTTYTTMDRPSVVAGTSFNVSHTS